MLQSQISAFQKRQEKIQALQAESAAEHQRSVKQQTQQQQQQQKDGKGPSAGAGGSVQVQGRVLDPANWMKDKDYYTAKREAQRAPLGMKIKKVIDLLFKVCCASLTGGHGGSPVIEYSSCPESEMLS